MKESNKTKEIGKLEQLVTFYNQNEKWEKEKGILYEFG